MMRYEDSYMGDAGPDEAAITLSPLGHTWLFDIDGTIFAHNPKLSGDHDDVGPDDTLLPGVAQFWEGLPDHDFVIRLSARHTKYRSMTENALRAHGLRYDEIIFGLPKGERILLNDAKPRGLLTAHAVNLVRDAGLSGLTFHIDPKR